jgi:ParB family chromosome partitioning protein
VGVPALQDDMGGGGVTTATHITDIALALIDVHPDDPRYSTGDVRALADSIAELGVLEPLILVPDGHRFRVLAGHRRRAALELLDFKTAPARLVDCDADRIHELRVIMASNTAREQLTPLEEARGYQTMLDLGLEASDVAKVTGRKRTHVERTAKLAGAFSEAHREQLVERPVSLEEYEALARHEGNEKRYKELLKALGARDFEWTAKRLDREATRQAVQERASAKLQKLGVKIVNRSYSSKQADVDDLLDDAGKKLTRKSHADCPGHAACINSYARSDKDAITYVCQDWKKHGHKHRFYTERGASQAEAESARKDREWKKRVKAVTADRRTFVRELLQKPVDEVGQAYLLYAARHRGFDLEAAGIALVVEWLGLTLPEKKNDYDRQEEALGAALDSCPPLRAMLALACAAGDEALRKSKHPESRHYGQGGAIRYLRFLEAAGYQLSDVERELLGSETKKTSGETNGVDGDTFTVPTCRVCGCTDEAACDDDGQPCHWVEPDLCSACAGKAGEAS